MASLSFEWDEKKNLKNKRKHGVSFKLAQRAFLDTNRIIAKDTDHSTTSEIRYYSFGKVDSDIVTVRFTYRNGKLRIFGAGYWRKGKRAYEEKNKIH